MACLEEKEPAKTMVIDNYELITYDANEQSFERTELAAAQGHYRKLSTEKFRE